MGIDWWTGAQRRVAQRINFAVHEITIFYWCGAGF